MGVAERKQGAKTQDGEILGRPRACPAGEEDPVWLERKVGAALTLVIWVFLKTVHFR